MVYQYLANGLLEHPVDYNRYAQLPLLAIRFGYFNAQYRLGQVVAIPQGFFYPFAVCAEMAIQLIHTHPVRTGAAFVGYYLAAGTHHIRWVEHFLNHRPFSLFN
jgi:hypothetical protein